MKKKSAERFWFWMANHLKPISRPLASIEPMLFSCVARKPPETGNCCATRRSLTCRCHEVNSMATRLSRIPASKPNSVSVEISGLRAGLPRLAGTRPAPSSEASGEKVVNLSNAPG